jgi:hypothetical protein
LPGSSPFGIPMQSQIVVRTNLITEKVILSELI